MMPLNSNALITVDDLFRYLKETAPSPGSDDEALAEQLINSASEEIERFVGCPIIHKTITEQYDGDGSQVLFLRNFPVVSVGSVVVDGEDITTDADFYEDGELFLYSNVFNPGKKNVSVTYTAGYAPNRDSVPADLKHACTLIAHYWYKRDSLDYSESFGESDVISPGPKYPYSALKILGRYKRYRVGLI